jgi:hypothetical protein
MAHIVDFERPNETGKAGAHLIHRKGIEFFQPISLPPNEKEKGNPVRWNSATFCLT